MIMNTNELQAAYLWGNLERVFDINTNRLTTWRSYYNVSAVGIAGVRAVAGNPRIL